MPTTTSQVSLSETFRPVAEAQTCRLTEHDSASRPVTRSACLVYIYPTGPLMGSRYLLGPGQVTIGRTEDCRVRNTDGSVSRLHAQIALTADGGYVVRDLGSTNGTFVNNARATEARLADGDYLRVGNCIYRFLASGNLEAEYHEEIYRLTVIDPLTGVHNRRFLLEYLDREMARAARYGRPLALVMLDIDRFKRINDTLGHLAGDTAIRELCARIKPLVRRDELLARYGGEEFAVALPEADAAAAGRFAERVRRAVADEPFLLGSSTQPVTVSAGVGAVAPGDQVAVADLIARADDNLYRAKQAGRNRVVC